MADTFQGFQSLYSKNQKQTQPAQFFSANNDYVFLSEPCTSQPSEEPSYINNSASKNELLKVIHPKATEE